MQKLIVRTIRFILTKTVGKKNLGNLVILIARLASVDLLLLYYQSIGILKYWNDTVSGEEFVVSSVLRKYFHKEDLSLFDIGANVGNYSKKLRSEFPSANIYAFEPNPNTFEVLNKNLTCLNIQCYSLGLSSKISQQKIYTYAREIDSEHASVYKNVLSDLHKASDILEIECKTISLDEFCETKKITYIDFIKIDTEGHELEVLSGATRMISENRIGIIQFEFNEMNIISRVFLKDFYEILKEYNIYRLDSNRLIPLFEYDSTNEIFKFQNFLAVNKKLET
jgi:FkbM family methyltransferase